VLRQKFFTVVRLKVGLINPGRTGLFLTQTLQCRQVFWWLELQQVAQNMPKMNSTLPQ